MTFLKLLRNTLGQAKVLTNGKFVGILERC